MTAKTVAVDSNLTISTRMYIWQCDCGIVYGVPVDFAESKRKSGGHYFCPAGCRLTFHETEADKQRKRADRAEADRDYWQREEGNEREKRTAAEHRERAQKAAKTRLKNRIAKGVCPCCKRHFANVQQHIEGQHPDFVSPDRTVGDA